MATTLNAGNATSGAAISADTTGILQLQSGSTPTTAVTITTAQNVGVGTSSPAFTSSNRNVLAVNGTTDSILGVMAGGTGQAYLQGTSTATNLFTANTNPLALGTNNAERMRITSDGNVLVNTTQTGGWSGDQVLSSKTSSASLAWAVSAWNDRASDGGAVLVRVDNTARQLILFHYTAATPVGSITTNGTTTSYNVTSDYRLKEDVAPMTGALATVSALKPVTYKWKSNGESSQGFIAHELQAVVPDAVTGEKDAVKTVNEMDEEGNVIGTKEVPEYQGIDTSFLVATLTAAIQELNAKVDAQALEIQALKGVA